MFKYVEILVLIYGKNFTAILFKTKLQIFRLVETLAFESEEVYLHSNFN